MRFANLVLGAVVLCNSVESKSPNLDKSLIPSGKNAAKVEESEAFLPVIDPKLFLESNSQQALSLEDSLLGRFPNSTSQALEVLLLDDPNLLNVTILVNGEKMTNDPFSLNSSVEIITADFYNVAPNFASADLLGNPIVPADECREVDLQGRCPLALAYKIVDSSSNQEVDEGDLLLYVEAVDFGVESGHLPETLEISYSSDEIDEDQKSVGNPVLEDPDVSPLQLSSRSGDNFLATIYFLTLGFSASLDLTAICHSSSQENSTIGDFVKIIDSNSCDSEGFCGLLMLSGPISALEEIILNTQFRFDPNNVQNDVEDEDIRFVVLVEKEGVVEFRLTSNVIFRDIVEEKRRMDPNIAEVLGASAFLAVVVGIIYVASNIRALKRKVFFIVDFEEESVLSAECLEGSQDRSDLVVADFVNIDNVGEEEEPYVEAVVSL